MTTEALSPSEFHKELARVVKLRQRFMTLLRPAAEALIDFATGYSTLFDGIKRDRGLVRIREMNTALDITQAQHQRLIAIAEQSKTLKAVTHALPAAIEPLYEVARMVGDADGKKRLHAAVQNNELTSESTMRDVRRIRQPKVVKQKHAPTWQLRELWDVPIVLRAGLQQKPWTWDELEAMKKELEHWAAKRSLKLSIDVQREHERKALLEVYWRLKKEADKPGANKQPRRGELEEELYRHFRK